MRPYVLAFAIFVGVGPGLTLGADVVPPYFPAPPAPLVPESANDSRVALDVGRGPAPPAEAVTTLPTPSANPPAIAVVTPTGQSPSAPVKATPQVPSQPVTASGQAPAQAVTLVPGQLVQIQVAPGSPPPALPVLASAVSFAPQAAVALTSAATAPLTTTYVVRAPGPIRRAVGNFGARLETVRHHRLVPVPVTTATATTTAIATTPVAPTTAAV